MLYKPLLTGLAAIALVSGQAPPAPDNTKTNQRDRNPGAVTADSQTMTKAERELAEKVRDSFVKDKTLSTYAHNVKIVAQGQQVTLKGPVRSQAEKDALERKAVSIAGKDNVVNELDIAPEK